MVDIDRLIEVSTQIAATETPRLTFGRVLLVGVDSAISVGGPGRVRLFDNLAALHAVVGTGAVRDAAAVYFAADPPPQGLYVGRWAHVDVPTSLSSGTPAAPDSAALSASNSTFTLNGTDVSVDLSAVAVDTYAEIATLVQSALQTDFGGATFQYVGNRFVLMLAGSTPIDDGALGDTDATTDTDVAAALGMAADSDGLTYVQGGNAESIADGLAAMIEVVASEPVGIVFASDVPITVGGVDTRLAASAFAEADDYVFALEDTSDQALAAAASDTTSYGAVALAQARGGTAVTYGALSAVGLIAIMSGQNLGNPNSSVSPHGKAIPGVTPVSPTAAQSDALDAKRINYVAQVYGQNTLLGGYTSRDGHWLDAVWWNVWLKDRIQRAIWSSIRGSRRLTRALLADALSEALQAGVRNGGIEPGRTVSTAIKADIISANGQPSVRRRPRRRILDPRSGAIRRRAHVAHRPVQRLVRRGRGHPQDQRRRAVPELAKGKGRHGQHLLVRAHRTHRQRPPHPGFLGRRATDRVP